MARIRSIKPDFFRHEALYEAEKTTGMPLRVAFAGLWTAADREGRFRWAPRALKLDCLPYDDVDFSRVLDALATRGFIVKYRVDGTDYGHIPSFTQHQVINNRESQSTLPQPTEENEISTREARVEHASPTPLVQDQGEGKGREGKGNAPDADASHSPEAELFRRGREVLGKQAGGLITKLLAAKQKNIPLARAAIEQASTKSDPREYIGAVIRGLKSPNEPNWLDGIPGVL
ncbi:MULTISPECIES: hypothetical protein [unclassified Bradyrhizobium]|uniref:hypothetical protein n=1 Tax=unclassified Bradyrhizobium TaxID=2631580 RepID=UPI00247A8850|nr:MULTISPECIES: hypothetical protein [unclassified Bradyrhizobium]WGR74322.1 hypothetical protein MTX24_16490 [Bradyrhizobium sp. ISRA426]WGR79157.1 hypothetical protein MTX21_01605 [Bradyrhizobium sp. ISRA430]WGR90644.1 hypothetical protein MTX25_39750 [Bradyrhizobium sp. ISRA432]